MRETFSKYYKELIEYEGGYVNHPDDPGGHTIWGVTKRNWDAYTDEDVPLADFRNLRPEDVKDFYFRNYWSAVRGDELPPGVDWFVFDYAVNSGVYRGSRALQMIIGEKTDGVIGRKTLATTANYIGEIDPKAALNKLVDALYNQRLSFLKSLKIWDTFGRGWQARLNRVRALARDIIRQADSQDVYNMLPPSDIVPPAYEVNTKPPIPASEVEAAKKQIKSDIKKVAGISTAAAGGLTYALPEIIDHAKAARTVYDLISDVPLLWLVAALFIPAAFYAWRIWQRSRIKL